MRRPPATEDDYRRVVAMAAIEPNQSRAADKLNIPRQTYAAMLRKAQNMGVKPQDVAKTPEWTKEKNALQERVRELELKLSQAQQEIFNGERIRDFIGLTKKSLPETPAWAVTPKKAGSPGVPLALWSDWHIGEVVFREQVAGVNEYNTDIARRRVKTLVEKIIHLCFHHTVNPTYPGIVVCLGGDMISGIIHEELRETNDLTAVRQCIETFKLIASALVTLADAFGKVWVIGVGGNHGRLTYKPRAKNRVQDILDYMIYQFL